VNEIAIRCPTTESLLSTIVVAFELSRAKWLIGVCLPGSDKLSRYTIDAGDLGALTAVLAEARHCGALPWRGGGDRVVL